MSSCSSAELLPALHTPHSLAGVANLPSKVPFSADDPNHSTFPRKGFFAAGSHLLGLDPAAQGVSVCPWHIQSAVLDLLQVQTGKL